MKAKKYELSFWGAGSVQVYRIPRYRKYHASQEEARIEASRVHAAMSAKGIPAAAHPPVIEAR
jgi:hypothetical protein